MVFKKEICDISRDKKTLFSTLLLPLIMLPLLFWLLGGSMGKIQEDVTHNTTVAFSDQARAVEGYLKDEVLSGLDGVRIVEGDALTLLREEKALVVLDVPADAQRYIDRGETVPITLVYDQGKTKSQGGLSLLMEHLQAYSDASVKTQLAAQGIDLEALRPIRAEAVDVQVYSGQSQSAGTGNMMLIMMLPMMITVFICTGGMGAATDLVAGEKERQTLEPLLSTQASRIAILLGKYAAVTVFSLVSLVATLGAYILSMKLNPLLFGDNVVLNLPAPAMLLAILTVVLLALTFSALQIGISTYARSFKEAQTYLSLLMVAVMIPAYATMMMQAGDVTMGMMLIPVLNVSCCLKMVLSGVYNYQLMLLGCGSTLVYMALALYLTSKLFKKESVLFRS
nr:ABC transporter permease [Maliibacterium massiliense]